TFTVDRLTDTGAGEGLAGDLRYCITNAADGDTIIFYVTGTLDIRRFLPRLTRSITIAGPGADVLILRRSATAPLGQYNIFIVMNATVSISGLRITRGSFSEGAGIYNTGTLTISDSTIAGNDAGCFAGTDGHGAGIYNAGTLTINNSTISGNEAGPCFITGK